MKPKCVCSGNSPKHFNIIQLHSGVFDVSIAENVREVIKKRRIPDAEDDKMEEVPQYEFDRYNAVVVANDYGSFIAGIIHLKFSVDDEVALLNKGIADSEDAEYKAYRDFVTEVKENARKYFNND